MTQLAANDKERFSRHLNIPGFDEQSQFRLKQARVLVVGAGGLGSPVLHYLASAGVGHLGIADFDRVERHNLQRQILFEDADVGQLKVEVAARRLSAIYPDIDLVLYSKGIQSENATRIIAEYDVIVDGSDNFGTRYLLTDLCHLLKKPLITGNVFQMEGQVMVFHSGNGSPCYRCLFPEPPTGISLPNCNEAGVVGALCGVIGSVQAMEVIKWITGLGRPLLGSLMKVDLANNRFTSIQLEKDPRCPLCGENPRIHSLNSSDYSIPCLPLSMELKGKQSHGCMGMEMDVATANHWVEQHNALWLDIREQDEADICQINGSLFIPMGEIPARVNELPKDRPLIVYCHHGMRSQRVVMYLRSLGIEHCTSLQGGINRWAALCDPEMARY